MKANVGSALLMLSAVMAAAFSKGLRYFLPIFTIAFAMGAARVLFIAPWLGPTAAVLLEVPFLVVVSWFVARHLLRHRSLTFSKRASMGATALTLTLASEVALASILRGQSATDWFADVTTPLGLVGFAGQLAFAAMPMIVTE